MLRLCSEPVTKATVIIEDVILLAEPNDLENLKAERLLKLHLDHCHIDTLYGIPAATLDTAVRFRDFARLFDAGDRSHEPNLWRLGVALFDELETGLPPDASDDLVARVVEIRRKISLSRWLKNAVAPAVDHDLLAMSENRPARVFALLSGNQVDRAVQSALDGNDMRLATLISQIGGPALFREEIMRQLEDWQKYKANPLIGNDYRRLYALLAGITDFSPGNQARGSDGCADVLVAEGLDWKRAFGLRLWYGNTFDDTVGDVFHSYTSALSSPHSPSPPLPPYLEQPTNLTKSWKMNDQPTDILYCLISLYADATASLDRVLRSRSCSPSPLDLRLPWHLYMLLSTVMNKRDFENREDGYSATADLVTSSYAVQLEHSGHWQWAAFVILHLESATAREITLKALLTRHPNTSTEEQSFLDSLQIPVAWVHEAVAAEFASAGDAFGEYRALLRAGLHDRAHQILKSHLAPEAVLRGDRGLLRRLCQPLESCDPVGWEYGGKASWFTMPEQYANDFQLFLDYVSIVDDGPRLLESVVRAGAHPKPRDTSVLSDLAHSIPRVLQILPALFPNDQDFQQIACLSDMLSDLHGVADLLHRAGYVSSSS